MSETELALPVAPTTRRRPRQSPPWWLLACAVVVALAFAVPFAYLVIRNAADPAAAGAVIASRDGVGPLLRSLLLAHAVSVTAGALGTAAAWFTVRGDVPGRRLWRVLLPLPLVIPSFIGAFALIAAFATGGLVERLTGLTTLPPVRGFAGAYLVLTLLTYPYVYLPVAARLQQLPPTLEEAARQLGRRPAAVFWSVVLPQIREAIAAGVLLVFLYTISDFGAVELLRYDTLTRVMYSAWTGLDAETGLALSLQLGVLAIVVVALERRFASRIPRGRDRDSRVSTRALGGLQVRLGRWRPAATALVFVTLAGGLLIPVAVLVYWAVRGVVGGAGPGTSLVSDPSQLLSPALNTAGVSLITAAVAVAVVLPVAFLVRRYRSGTGPVANAVVVGGFALPGLAIALALTFFTLRAPAPLWGAYQTMQLLVFAYVVHFGAQALRAADVAVDSVPARIDEAARSLGASRWRRFATIDLPLMAPGLLAGGGLVLLSTMKELPATLLLAPPGFETLATRIWNAAEDAFLAEASIASLVLIALSGLLTWVFVVRRAEALE